MLVNFDPPGDLFTRWGIDLFSPPDLFYRYFRSGDRFIGPQIALGGIESHLTPAPIFFTKSADNWNLMNERAKWHEHIQIRNRFSRSPLPVYIHKQNKTIRLMEWWTIPKRRSRCRLLINNDLTTRSSCDLFNGRSWKLAVQSQNSILQS